MNKLFALAAALLAVTFASTVSAFEYGYQGWRNSQPSVGSDIAGATHNRSNVRELGRAVTAVVVTTRDVRVEPTNSSSVTGTGLGALAGAAAGSQVGKGNGQLLGIAAGAIIGGIAGKALTEKVADDHGQEIVVRTSDGRLLAIVQGADELFAPGQDVLLVNHGQQWRVTAAGTRVLPPPKKEDPVLGSFGS